MFLIINLVIVDNAWWVQKKFNLSIILLNLFFGLLTHPNLPLKMYAISRGQTDNYDVEWFARMKNN